MQPDYFEYYLTIKESNTPAPSLLQSHRSGRSLHSLPPLLQSHRSGRSLYSLPPPVNIGHDLSLADSPFTKVMQGITWRPWHQDTWAALGSIAGLKYCCHTRLPIEEVYRLISIAVFYHAGTPVLDYIASTAGPAPIQFNEATIIPVDDHCGRRIYSSPPALTFAGLMDFARENATQFNDYSIVEWLERAQRANRSEDL